MARFPKNKKTAFKTKKRSSKNKKTLSVSTSVKQYVQKAIAVQQENKMQNVATSKTFNTNFGLWDDISPTIFNNTSSSGRIGNQVRIKSVKMRYVLNLTPAIIAPYNPFVYGQFNFRLLIGHLVVAPYSSPNAADNLQLLRNGNTPVGPDSSLLSMVRPINKEWFKIYVDKRLKVGVANQGANPFTANNDYSVVQMGTMNITKAYKKLLRFEDASSRPTNTGVFLNAILTDFNGTPTVYLNPPVSLTYELDIIYEDA